MFFSKKKDITFPDYIEIKPNARAKRFTLKVNTKQRRIDLVIPKRASMAKAHQFFLRNESWAAQKYAEIPEDYRYSQLKELSVLGTLYALSMDIDPIHKRSKISFKDNILAIAASPDNAENRINRFLKKQAKEYFLALAKSKAQEINKKINMLSVRDTTSRWGSCSENGNISLSWRLIFAPKEAIDYVIAHEVAHLVHMNHSDPFWKLCENLCISCDSFKNGRSWMKARGHELMRYGTL